MLHRGIARSKRLEWTIGGVKWPGPNVSRWDAHGKFSLPYIHVSGFCEVMLYATLHWEK